MMISKKASLSGQIRTTSLRGSFLKKYLFGFEKDISLGNVCCQHDAYGCLSTTTATTTTEPVATTEFHRLTLFGNHLLNLCKSAGMLILNGRIDRDRGIGEFTRDDTTSKSVVDYVISTPELFQASPNFRIHGTFPESDHRPISLSLSTARNVTGCRETHRVKWKPHYKYVWSRGDWDRLAYTMDDMVSESYRLHIIESVCIRVWCRYCRRTFWW